MIAANAVVVAVNPKIEPHVYPQGKNGMIVPVRVHALVQPGVSVQLGTHSIMLTLAIVSPLT